MVINYTNINKTNNYLSQNTKKTMTYEVGNIQAPACDSQQNEAVFNKLMWSQSSFCMYANYRPILLHED